MAWIALQNWFLKFRKTPYVDMVLKYRIFLYDSWFDSLSKEEQQKEIERIFIAKQKKEQRLSDSITRFNAIGQVLDNLTNGNFSRYNDTALNTNISLNLQKSKYW